MKGLFFLISQLLIYVLLCIDLTFSQSLMYETEKEDSFEGLKFRFSSLSTLSSELEQAFWLTRNDYGLLSEQGANALFIVDGFTQKLNAKKVLGQETHLAAGWKMAYNFQSNQGQVYFPILFGRIDWGPFRMQAGRFNMRWDNNVDERIYSGDILYGTNSTPIPMIQASTHAPLRPFKKWLPEFGVKGYLLHGWFENNRYVRAAYLHAKNITLELDLDGFIPMFGFSHNAQWAGTSKEYGNLPDTFSDLMDVFTGRSSSSDSAPEGEVINVAGNHIGAWNMGFDMETDNMRTAVRFHHIFEDGSGKRMRNGSDGKISVSMKRLESRSGNKNPLVSELTYEYYNTTNASGMGSTDAPILGQAFDEFGYRYGGRDAYFYNFIYLSGWTYRDQPINSPFFMTLSEAERLAPEGQNPEGTVIDGYGIASGSILAHHIGWKGSFQLFGKQWRYRQKTSIVRYFGMANELPFYFAPYRYRDDVISSEYAFYPDVTQYYVRVDIEQNIRFFSQDLLTTLSIAVDRGEWQRNFGVGLQLEWEF